MLIRSAFRPAAVAACLLITAVLSAQARRTVTPRPAFAEPSIAPDGSEIAFVSGGDIWTVPGAGGQARLLISHAANDTHPVYSPDKSKLAFVSTRTGGGRLGYVHMADMSAASLAQLHVDLDADNFSRDGVVIDVRNNNGGFVNHRPVSVFMRQGSNVSHPFRSPWNREDHNRA